jgi:septal ring factor EnvC (AmiA/AmiB activator)
MISRLISKSSSSKCVRRSLPYILLFSLLWVLVPMSHSLTPKETIVQQLEDYQNELRKVAELIESSKQEMFFLQNRILDLEDSLQTSEKIMMLSEQRLEEQRIILEQSRQQLIESQVILQEQETRYKLLLKDLERLSFLLKLFQISSAILLLTTVLFAIF